MSLPPDLAALYASFARSNDEINSFQLPRLQSCSSDSQLADYDAELNSSIDGLKRTLNQLELAVDESESAQERTAVLQAVNALKKHLEQTRQSSRKALVTARRAVQSASVISARQGLQLAADSAKERTGGRGGGSSGEDKLMTTSQDVTDALRRTVELMSAELEKSALSSTLLDESSQTLASLSTQYGSLSTLMTNSVKLIKTMEREDLIGKGIVAAAMLFFLSCVGYILYVRVFSKGIGLLAFFWRLLGLNRLLGGGAARTVEDVQDKVGIALASSSTAAAISTALASSAAATASAAAAGGIALAPDLEQQLYQGNTATLTRKHTLPTERVEL